MFRENSLGVAPSEPYASYDVLRHPDGSIDLEAYSQRARRARAEAFTASFWGALSAIGGMLAGKRAPAAKHRVA